MSDFPLKSLFRKFYLGIFEKRDGFTPEFLERHVEGIFFSPALTTCFSTREKGYWEQEIFYPLRDTWHS